MRVRSRQMARRSLARLARLAQTVKRSFWLLAAVPAVAASQTPRGAVAGTITDSLGAVVVRAEVTIGGSLARALTDANGTYRLQAVPAGRGTLSVRRLGFRPAFAEVDVSADRVTRADVRLAPAAQRLAPVEVRERREVYDARLAGFNDRRAKKKAGHFITRERLERTHSFRFTDVLREVPGLRIGTARGGMTRFVRMRGAGCPPLVFVDGFPAGAGEFDLDMIDLATVEGIEVYSSMSTVPAELLGPRGLDRCGVIAVWSRPARARWRSDVRPRHVVDLAALVDSRRIYTADGVDSAARFEPGSVSPVYPDSLWRAKIGGRVVVEFVVDSAGTIELNTIGVVSSTHAAFAEAVRVGLEGARFVPAILAGRRVRQLIQMPFLFEPEAGLIEPTSSISRP